MNWLRLVVGFYDGGDELSSFVTTAMYLRIARKHPVSPGLIQNNLQL
jgi:hypothetical protein